MGNIFALSCFRDRGAFCLLECHIDSYCSHSMGFQYNGKLRAPEVLIRTAGGGDGLRADLIRARESVHCLFDNTIMPLDLQLSSAGDPLPFPYAGRAAAPSGASATFTALSEGPRRASGVQAVIREKPVKSSTLKLLRFCNVDRDSQFPLSVLIAALGGAIVVVYGISKFRN